MAAHRRLIALVLATLSLLLFTASVGHAAGSIVVNKLTDTTGSCATTGTGTCTLRDAIKYANAHSGANTITFSVGGTITLGSTLPAINDTLTIDGSGHAITVSGNNSVRVLVVNKNKTLNLKNLTIANGNCNNCNGGGTLNQGTLTITGTTFSANRAYSGGGIANAVNGVVNTISSTFSDNSAFDGGGGILNQGTLIITYNTFLNNNVATGAGGGIFNAGQLTIAGANFYGNSASSGGSIENAGTLTVTHVTFVGNSSDTNGGGIKNTGKLQVTDSEFASNNSAGGGGGGIYSLGTNPLSVADSTFSANGAGLGGGIYNSGSPLSVTNSTFVANSASLGGGIYSASSQDIATVTNSTLTENSAFNGGGGIYSHGTLTVTNSTFSGNGVNYEGGSSIYQSGSTTTLQNTIITDSIWGANCFNNDGTLTADSHNLADDNSCGGATQVTGGQIALLPLNRNGGLTQTMALDTGSVAIDTGDNAVCASSPVNNLDQRGYVRIAAPNLTCDVGAFESNSIGTPTPVPTPIPCDKPGKPMLLSPKNGATVNTRQVTLDWQDLLCATGYEVQVRQGSTSGTLVDHPTDLSSSQYTTLSLLRGRTYFWRVRGKDALGAGPWTAYWSFKVSPKATLPLSER